MEAKLTETQMRALMKRHAAAMRIIKQVPRPQRMDVFEAVIWPGRELQRASEPQGEFGDEYGEHQYMREVVMG